MRKGFVCIISTVGIIGILLYGTLFIEMGHDVESTYRDEEMERIFHPRNHHEEFLHSMLITDLGLIQDYYVSDITFYAIPEKFKGEIQFTNWINNREYIRSGSMLQLFPVYPGITHECLERLSLNLFTTAINTKRGPGKVAHNLISTLHTWGIEPKINEPYERHSTNLMLDYWGSTNYDEILFISALSPKLDPTRKASFFDSGAVFVLSSEQTGSGYRLRLTEDLKGFELRPIKREDWNSDYTPCTDAYLFLAYALVDNTYLVNRARTIQSEYLNTTTNFLVAPNTNTHVKFWEALDNLRATYESFGHNNFSFENSKIIHVFNANGTESQLSPIELLQTYSWIPQLNIISNNCGLADWLRSLPMCRNFPVLTLPVGVDTQRFFPLYRYWAKERKSRVMILVKRQQVEPFIAFTREYLATRIENVEFLRFDYGTYEEEEFMDAASSSSFVLVFDNSETQGFALEELMSMDVPMFVYHQSSIPYFDSQCGTIFLDYDGIPKIQNGAVDNTTLALALDDFMNRLENREFSPREFIAKYLTFSVTGGNLLQHICSWLPDSPIESFSKSCGLMVDRTEPLEIIHCLSGRNFSLVGFDGNYNS